MLSYLSNFSNSKMTYGLARLKPNRNPEIVCRIATGMAWVFDRYSKPTGPLYPLQEAAKAAKRGLWADNQPVPPWG